MKVLHLISSGGMYGAEAVILNLSHCLNEGGHFSVLGVFSNSSNPNLQLYDRAVKQGVESHLIECKGQIDRGVAGRIRELVARTKPDVVHTHGYKADLYAYFALRASRTPLVSTCHGWIEQDFKVTLYGILDRFILRSYPRIVVVSDEVREKLVNSKADIRKIKKIKNGIDLRPFEYKSTRVKDELGWHSHLLVGMVARLSHEKGVDLFLKAAALVLSNFPDIKFVVAGDGPDRDVLNASIDELGIHSSIRMLGRRDDMADVYASFDIMVSASRQEGLPIALLEGMASRLPIIATPVGEVPTVIRDGSTGLIVPMDDPKLLAAKIEELLRNPAQQKQLGAAARRLVEDEFSAERMRSEYLGLYGEAITIVAKHDEPQAKPAVRPQGK